MSAKCPSLHDVDHEVESGVRPVDNETKPSSEQTVSPVRLQGRALASRDASVAISSVSSYRNVCAALSVSLSTVSGWCDANGKKTMCLGDVYALALRGQTELATTILTSALAAVRAIASERRAPQSTVRHIHSLAARFGELMIDFERVLDDGVITEQERFELADRMIRIVAKCEGAIRDLTRKGRPEERNC